jgi:hypothetical protein
MSEELKEGIQAEEEEVVSEELKKLNRSWIRNPYLVVASLILGPATFVGAFFIDFESVWQYTVQSIVFLLSAGFFVILFSYGFNQLWLYAAKKKSNRDYFALTAIQLGIVIPLIVNAIDITKYISAEKVEDSSIFLILTIVYFIVAGILLLTLSVTVRKIKQPIDFNDYKTFIIAIVLGAIFAVAVFFGIFYFNIYAYNHVFV